MNDYIEFELNNRKLKIHRENSEDMWIWFCKCGNHMLKNPYWKRKAIWVNKQKYKTCSIGNRLNSEKKYMLHRVVYYAHNQDWDINTEPRKNPIDHIDENKQNNDICNLRVGTMSLNQQNQKKVKGYRWDKKRQRYCVYISVNGKKYHLGRYKKEEDAIEARRKGKEKYHEW